MSKKKGILWYLCSIAIVVPIMFLVGLDPVVIRLLTDPGFLPAVYFLTALLLFGLVMEEGRPQS